MNTGAARNDIRTLQREGIFFRRKKMTIPHSIVSFRRLFLSCFSPTSNIHSGESLPLVRASSSPVKAPSTVHRINFKMLLPLKLICHENGALWKCSSNRRNLKTTALRLSSEEKVLITSKTFSCPRFLGHKSKCTIILTFVKHSQV